MDLVSVIVPVYNVEKYLRDCLDSIIQQTYTELEIILVDDGSPDTCGQICDEYARNDSRITVIHKENGGLSDARNCGIAKAHGDFLMFVDSDDVIAPNLVEETLRLIHKYDADVVMTGTNIFSTSPDWNTDSAFAERCVSPHDALREALYQRDFDHGAWAKLYRREIWADTEFPKGMYYEDAVTTYKIFFRSSRIAMTDKKLYGYRMRPSSQSKATVSPKMLQVIPMGQLYYSGVKETFPDLRRAVSSRVFSLNRSAYLNYPFSKKKERMMIWEEMKKYRRAIIFDPMARKRERIAALLSYLGADIFHILFSWLYKKQQVMK